MNKLDIRDKAEVLKLLGHSTRLLILEELAKGAKCVTDIQDLLDIEQSNLSQHLSVLRKLKIVDFHEDGSLRCYYIIRPQMVDALFQFISGKYPIVKRACEEVRKEGEKRRAKR
ncbi:MAG: metalloregulator ArsR/SmtB family transcription factor [Candidatus Brocadiaceae bacterium]|nr:metalloregulator ArsR/SmtB family transcription factor [Candidatus Brocadiaceae bacterium]